MIDREVRDRLAYSIERMLSGELTFGQFGSEVSDLASHASPDDGVKVSFNALDDIDEEAGHWRNRPLTTKYYSEKSIRKVRRVARFLRTNLEYEWPPFDGFDTYPDSLLKLWAAFGSLAIPILAGYLVSTHFAFGLLSFVGVMALAYANAIGCWWLSNSLLRKAHTSEMRRHLAAGRDVAVWPFCRREDVPMELADDFEPATHPQAAPQPLR